MYSLRPKSLIVVIPRLALLSLSFPADDDLNSNTLLFDTQDPPSFLDETQILTTDAQIPCAAPNDLSLTEDGTNLFAREDGAQCLPPVNIGADVLQLFDDPLNSLENTITLPLPLEGSDETSGDPIRPSYPGLLPGDETGNFRDEDLEKLGAQPYTGPVRIEVPENNNCKALTAHLGNFNYELCCDGDYVSTSTRSPFTRERLQPVDAETIANHDYTLVYSCIFATPSLPCPISYSARRVCCSVYYPTSEMGYSCKDLSRYFRAAGLL